MKNPNVIRSVSDWAKMSDTIRNPYVRSIRKKKDNVEDFSDVDTRTLDPMDSNSYIDNNCSMFNGTRSDFNDINFHSNMRDVDNENDIEVDL